jgi:predicted Zn-dependent peptidase
VRRLWRPRHEGLAAAALLLGLTLSGSPALGALPGAAAPPPDDPRGLRFDPLVLSFPRPETYRLKNGLVAYLLRDPELPIVDLAFYLRGGAIHDPPDRAGLAVLSTHLMRTGGTRTMTPDQVDEALEALPATLTIDAADDALSGRLSCLRDKFPQALRILAATLREPRFDAGRLEVEKSRLVEEIRRRWDDPGTIADLTFRMLVYGDKSPWARLETVESVGRTDRNAVLEFHRRYIRPNGALLAVSGDFEPEDMKRRLRDAFGGWEGGRADLPAVPKIEDSVSVGVHLVSRPLTQSSIVLGHLGATRFDPDRFALFVLNDILGEGGFASRLMKEVRSTRGLAYSVSGGVGSDSDRGLFEITCRTRADATVQAIEAIREVVLRLREDGPTEEEMRRAKEAQLNSFVFTVDGTAPYMRAYLYYRHYGYPDDYLMTWRDRLARVGRDDVMRAARRFLHPEALAVLVVGDPKAFDRPLEDLGLGAPRLIQLGDAGAPPAAPASGSAAPPALPAAPAP